MSVLPAAPAATPDVGDDPDRTPEGDVRVPLVPLLVGGGVWRTDGVKGSSEPSPTPVVDTEHMFVRVATMSRTRTMGRFAVAIGTGIAALAISLTAPDIASARPSLCERGIHCPPPKPPPVDPDQRRHRHRWWSIPGAAVSRKLRPGLLSLRRCRQLLRVFRFGA